MSENSIGYEEYLARVTAQANRDRDRFTGVDEHLDEPIYDPETGKRLNRVVPALLIELDDEGLPSRWILRTNDDATGRVRPETRALFEAAEHMTHRGFNFPNFRNPREEAIRLRELHAEMQRQEAEKWAAFVAEHPFACATCKDWYSPLAPILGVRVYEKRFKTERGLNGHNARFHKPEAYPV